MISRFRSAPRASALERGFVPTRVSGCETTIMFMIVVFQLTPRTRYSLGLVCPPSCNFSSPLIPGREPASATPYSGSRAQPHDVQPPLTTWLQKKNPTPLPAVAGYSTVGGKGIVFGR